MTSQTNDERADAERQDLPTPTGENFRRVWQKNETLVIQGSWIYLTKTLFLFMSLIRIKKHES